MDWPIRLFKVADLKLDQHNIRTPISDEDQNALIRDMFANEEAFEIAKSYVQHGVFPDEFPIVIVEDQKEIVIEGNRRLAALKALNLPAIVPAWEKRIRTLNNPGIKAINAVVAPSRDSAITHIANKHTINYRRNWKPLRQAYFYKSQIDNGKTIEDLLIEFPDHDVPKFWKMIEMHHLAKSMDLHELAKPKIHDDRHFPITNLERFYNDKKVAGALGIEFDKLGRVHGKVAKSEFEKGYKKLVEDVALGEIDSRKYNTAKERESYLNKNMKQYLPDLKQKGSFNSSDFAEVKPKDPVNGKTNRPGKRQPKGLFYKSDMPFSLPSTPLRLVYNELAEIDVVEFPNATHDLMRSFLECSLVYYLKHTDEFSVIQKNCNHNPTLSEMLEFISSNKCKSIDNDTLKQTIKTMKSSLKDSFSLARMNMINHDENWTSTGKDVRSAWGKIESLFKTILNPIS